MVSLGWPGVQIFLENCEGIDMWDLLVNVIPMADMWQMGI